MEELLSRRLNFIVPVLPNSDSYFLFASCQAFIRLIGELLKGHADLPSVLDVGLVLFVMKLGWLLC